MQTLRVASFSRAGLGAGRTVPAVANDSLPTASSASARECSRSSVSVPTATPTAGRDDAIAAGPSEQHIAAVVAAGGMPVARHGGNNAAVGAA